jgi:hypothetical protein
VRFVDQGICKNAICYSGSSQGIRFYNTCLFSISPDYASFTRECHGTGDLQAQTTSIYDVIGQRSILFLPRVWTESVW